MNILLGHYTNTMAPIWSLATRICSKFRATLGSVNSVSSWI
jgi:hypothetical protein